MYKRVRKYVHAGMCARVWAYVCGFVGLYYIPKIIHKKYVVFCHGLIPTNKPISQIRSRIMHTFEHSVRKCCIVGYGTGTLWDLYDTSYSLRFQNYFIDIGTILQLLRVLSIQVILITIDLMSSLL